jgi:hypothetical protein
MTTSIALTFDIEFSINGAFAGDGARKPVGRDGLICPVKGKDAGLGTILDSLDAHSLKATFFIEALQTAYFDDAEMGDVVDRIAARGHELQLHLHPVWLQFDNPGWKAAVKRDPPATATHDSLAAVAPDRALEMIERGKAVFQRWGLPAPTAVRTGSLIMERELYDVFAAAGLMVSSSVGTGIYQPQDPDLDLFAAPRLFDGVLELPVTSYLGADPLLRRRKRLATVIGMGAWEQDALLEQAQRAASPCMVILSHVSEFCTLDDDGRPHPNHTTVRKFDRLCHALAQSPGLKAATINEVASKFRDDVVHKDVELAVPRVISASRFLERLGR